MPVSGNSINAKNWQSFQISEDLLRKVTEAVEKGESQARSSGEVKSFEIFYLGYRQNISIGRIFIVPASICNKPKEFPIALLYGTVVKLLNLGEETAGLIELQTGSEFDEEDDAKETLKMLKEKAFTVDGKEVSLIVFAPAWSGIREYVAFQFVDDTAKLTNLLRHLVFSCYFNPSVSSGFDALMTQVDTWKIDVTDITPKLTYPALTESPLKKYPELMKAASVRKRIFLTAKTADAIAQEQLEPAEMDVFQALGEAVGGALDHETTSPAEVAEKDYKTPKSNAEVPRADDGTGPKAAAYAKKADNSFDLGNREPQMDAERHSGNSICQHCGEEDGYHQENCPYLKAGSKRTTALTAGYVVKQGKLVVAGPYSTTDAAIGWILDKQADGIGMSRGGYEVEKIGAVSLVCPVHGEVDATKAYDHGAAEESYHAWDQAGAPADVAQGGYLPEQRQRHTSPDPLCPECDRRLTYRGTAPQPPEVDFQRSASGKQADTADEQPKQTFGMYVDGVEKGTIEAESKDAAEKLWWKTHHGMKGRLCAKPKNKKKADTADNPANQTKDGDGAMDPKTGKDKPITAAIKKVSYVVHCKGHHNSKGELAEWCIKSHETGKILSSHTSESAAKSHLQDMHAHSGSAKQAETKEVDLGGKGSFKVHPGRLHKHLGIPEGQTIPESRLQEALKSDNEDIRNEAKSAIGLKHMHHGSGKNAYKVHDADCTCGFCEKKGDIADNDQDGGKEASAKTADTADNPANEKGGIEIIHPKTDAEKSNTRGTTPEMAPEGKTGAAWSNDLNVRKPTSMNDIFKRTNTLSANESGGVDRRKASLKTAEAQMKCPMCKGVARKPLPESPTFNCQCGWNSDAGKRADHKTAADENWKAQQALHAVDDFFDTQMDEDLPKDALQYAIQALEGTRDPSLESAKLNLERAVSQEDFGSAIDWVTKARRALSTFLGAQGKLWESSPDEVADAIAEPISDRGVVSSLKSRQAAQKREADLRKKRSSVAEEFGDIFADVLPRYGKRADQSVEPDVAEAKAAISGRSKRDLANTPDATNTTDASDLEKQKSSPDAGGVPRLSSKKKGDFDVQPDITSAKDKLDHGAKSRLADNPDAVRTEDASKFAGKKTAQSVSYDKCNQQGHHRTRHSPNGIDIIEECEQCHLAWTIKGGTGEVILMPTWMDRGKRADQSVEPDVAQAKAAIEGQSKAELADNPDATSTTDIRELEKQAGWLDDAPALTTKKNCPSCQGLAYRMCRICNKCPRCCQHSLAEQGSGVPKERQMYASQPDKQACAALGDEQDEAIDIGALIGDLADLGANLPNVSGGEVEIIQYGEGGANNLPKQAANDFGHPVPEDKAKNEHIGQLVMGLWKGGDDSAALHELATYGCLIAGQTPEDRRIAVEVRNKDGRSTSPTLIDEEDSNNAPVQRFENGRGELEDYERSYGPGRAKMMMDMDAAGDRWDSMGEEERRQLVSGLGLEPELENEVVNADWLELPPGIDDDIAEALKDEPPARRERGAPDPDTYLPSLEEF